MVEPFLDAVHEQHMKELVVFEPRLLALFLAQ
jgi:hypothetical protein